MYVTTKSFVDRDEYEDRLIESFCRLSDAVAMTEPVLGPQANLGGTDVDIYNHVAGTIEALAAAWPRIDPTLDEVRNGQQDIEGEHITGAKCKMDLRTQLQDAFRARGCSPDMADVCIEVLRARRKERAGDTPVPTIAHDRYSNLSGPLPPKVGHGHGMARHLVHGTTTADVVMQYIASNVPMRGTFTAKDAADALEPLGYSRTSVTGALAYCEGAGKEYIEFIGGTREERRYRYIREWTGETIYTRGATGVRDLPQRVRRG